MIVRKQSDGSVVMITQNDHAKLSGLFAAHWGNDRFAKPRPFASVVRAAQYHDAGWFRYETSPHFDAGTHSTPNFQSVANDEAQLAAHQAGIDMVSAVDPYSGLLVSRHRTGLWQSRYGVISEPPPGPARTQSAEVEAFIARNEAQQKALAVALDPHEVAVNYSLLQVWDLLSLYICTNERLSDRTIGPVPTTYAERDSGVRMRMAPRSPTSILVYQYPFDRPSLEIGVVYRRLPGSALADATAFQAAYFGACPQVARFVLVGES